MGNCRSSTYTFDSRKQSLRNNIIRERINQDVHKKYEITKRLGFGALGTVCHVRIKGDAAGGSAYKKKYSTQRSPAVLDRKVKVDYAMKSVQLRKMSKELIEELRHEVHILRSLDHPNIVKVFEVFDNSKQIYMVMELCSGGDLYKRKPYTEKEAAKIVGKLLSAVKYMHDHDIIHRDLKFENIMFENTSADAEIKVIDFGLSSKFSETEPYLYDQVGTISTVAPEVLKGEYTKQADLWSVGIIAHTLLSGQMPFYDKTMRIFKEKIIKCEYDLHHPPWETISDEAKNFVSSLIEKNPVKRLTAEQALQHKWQSKEFPLSDRRPSMAVMEDVENNLLTFGNTSELRKLALVLVAHNSTAEEISCLRQVFDQYDKGNDGRICYQEFQEAMKENNSHMTENELDEAFKKLDINQNGSILYTEFIAACLDAQGTIEEERIAAAFDRIDSDDTGFISKNNLLDLLGQTCAPERVEELMKEASTKKDGKIFFDEFLQHCQENNLKRRQEVTRLISQRTNQQSGSISLNEANLVNQPND